MNGLKAYELMLQGETVVLNEKYYSIIGDMVYISKGEDAYPCLAFPINHEGFVVAGEEVAYPKNVGRVPKGHQFYSITRRGGVIPLIDKRDKRCNEYYKVGNYFTSRKEALEVARKEIADRLALRAKAREEFKVEVVDYTVPLSTAPSFVTE